MDKNPATIRIGTNSVNIFETEVLDIIERASAVKSFRLKVENGFEFQPGQFFLLSIMIDGQERSKHFSFSNSPTETGYIEFTKRITDSDFSKVLDNLKVGDWARVKGPFGSFTLKAEDERIAFLSGGIGITPIRSMCKFVTDKALPIDIVLLYGNNTEKDIIFRDDFDNMQKANKNLRIVYTLTTSCEDEDTLCRKGFIDEKMIREEVPDYKERTFLICGPPNMVTKLTDLLRSKLDIAEDKIRLENFTGY
ncbi:MAG: FAD-dependent oxidoreductase [Candidatus Omnitrophica bacterium]|nr:FAD-dependent oxidoreductase [Candidatus Omnitrophota bacterium]